MGISRSAWTRCCGSISCSSGNLLDPKAEDAICDSESNQHFAQVEMTSYRINYDSALFAICSTRHGLTKAIFEPITALLEERRLVLGLGNYRWRGHHLRAEFDQERHRQSQLRDEAGPQTQ
jgi:hypothetical protein